MTDQVDFATVKSINEIAHLMQLKTIAQAVENRDIFNRLKEIKVDYVQGYWISKPKPLDSMFEFAESELKCEV